MNTISIFKKNKSSILLLSCLALTVMKIHAQPIVPHNNLDDDWNNVSKNNSPPVIPESKINFSAFFYPGQQYDKTPDTNSSRKEKPHSDTQFKKTRDIIAQRLSGNSNSKPEEESSAGASYADSEKPSPEANYGSRGEKPHSNTQFKKAVRSTLEHRRSRHCYSESEEESSPEASSGSRGEKTHSDTQFKNTRDIIAQRLNGNYNSELEEESSAGASYADSEKPSPEASSGSRGEKPHSDTQFKNTRDIIAQRLNGNYNSEPEEESSAGASYADSEKPSPEANSGSRGENPHSDNAYGSHILNYSPLSVLEMEDINIDIQNTTIENNPDDGITIIKNLSGTDEFFSPDAAIDKSHIIVGDNYGITNHYSYNDCSLDKNSSWDMTSSYDINNLYNAGNIILSKGDDVGMGLLVRNDYIGKNGTITFNPTIVGNNILSDKLIIKGNSSGLTNVSINSIGGISSASLNDLEFIHIDGLSDGIFKQSGRIVAGAYDYSLVRGHGNNSGNWYLTNQQAPRTTADNRIERPEAASYIANLSAANTLFTTTLSDRSGETQFTDAQTGEKKVTSLWLRQIGNHNNWRDSNDQLKTQSNSYITQLGGDIMQWSTHGHNRGRLGLMAGYGNNRSNSRSSITNYHSKASVKGYSVGAYGNWFANDTDKSGLYVDGWLQYNWFNNHVQGQKLSGENYTSKGLNAAVETGYTIKIGEFIKSQGIVDQWFIQPQAQVTRMGVKAKNHREANGTRVTSGGEGNIQTRLGIRTSLKGQNVMDKDKNREFEPFIEANWLHNTRSFSATMDGDRVTQAGARNIGEAKIGVAGKINSKVNLWGNIGVQVADKGYNNTSAMVGVKYHF